MPLPAFLIPALTGFALSKLTGASTKKALQSALLGAAVGGVTQGFGASATREGVLSQIQNAPIGTSTVPALPDTGITSLAGSLLEKGAGKVPGFGDMSYNQLAGLGIGGGLLYKSFADSAKAPKKSLFYGANVNYADPKIFSQVGPP
jgi:hypothetical protein